MEVKINNDTSGNFMESKMDKYEFFVNDYMDLCKKYNLHLEAGQCQLEGTLIIADSAPDYRYIIDRDGGVVTLEEGTF
jgi:hypothetical protein